MCLNVGLTGLIGCNKVNAKINNPSHDPENGKIELKTRILFIIAIGLSGLSFFFLVGCLIPFDDPLVEGSENKTSLMILTDSFKNHLDTVPYGHLLFDLTPKTVDSLTYCTNSGSVPTRFYLPAGIETKFLDDEHTIRLYSPNISKIFPKASKTIHSQLPKRFPSISERVFSKPIKRGASRSSERRRSKISKRNFRTNTKKNSSTQKKNYFKFN